MEWRDIPGFKSYQASSDGQIRNKKTLRVLKPSIRNSYLSVSVTKNMKVHRLVALAFIPNLENKPHIDHIDRNRSNNKIDNLRWSTQSENNSNRCTGKGVNRYIYPELNKFTVRIELGEHSFRIGPYLTIEQARFARDKLIEEVW